MNEEEENKVVDEGNEGHQNKHSKGSARYVVGTFESKHAKCDDYKGQKVWSGEH